MKIYLNNVCEFFCLLACLYYYQYLRGSFLKSFMPFLALVFVGEMYAGYQGLVLKRPNYDIYYVLGVVETIFYAFIFYRLTNNELIKKMILIFTPGIVIAYIIGFIFYLNIYRYFFIVGLVGGSFLAIVALAYIYSRIVEEDQVNVVSKPGFWIALGVSLFFSVSSISFSVSHRIFAYDLRVFGIRLYNVIDQLLCIVLYGSIAIGIAQSKKRDIKNIMP